MHNLPQGDTSCMLCCCTDHFGTLIICLPSRFKGGQLVLRHIDPNNSRARGQNRAATLTRTYDWAAAASPPGNTQPCSGLPSTQTQVRVCVAVGGGRWGRPTCRQTLNLKLWDLNLKLWKGQQRDSESGSCSWLPMLQIQFATAAVALPEQHYLTLLEA